MEEFDEIKKELDAIAPKLGALPKVNAFKVDDAYFDRLPMVVMDRIHARKPRRGIDLSWLFQPKWTVTMAICFIAVVFGSYLLVKNINTDKAMPVAEVQKLLVEPITNDNVIDNVDADDLVDALARTEKEQIKTKDLKKSANKKAIEEYILDNVDESAIIDAL
jgi:hypothetical protein